MNTRVKTPLLQIMIFVLLVLCAVPAWGTPLHDAAGKGDTATAKALIEAGADVRAADNIFGRTALHEAAKNGHAAVVMVLVKAGADICATDNRGQTALHLAAEKGHIAVVMWLWALTPRPRHE